VRPRTLALAVEAALDRRKVCRSATTLVTKGLSRLVVVLAVMTAGLSPTVAHGQGGPPLITDDPGTVEKGHWEVNVALTAERTEEERAFEAPLLDINYGLTERLQLKYEAAFLVVDEPGDEPRGTISNSLVGVKWRFLDEDRHGVAMSFDPQVEFNNPGMKQSDRELAGDGTQVLLPIEISRTFGRLSLGAEVGYNFIEFEGDEWKYGLAAGYALTDRLQLLAEVAGVVDDDFHRTTPILNAGFRLELRDDLTLLFAAGRGLRSSLAEDDPSLLVYAGLSFSF
jgi:hypothetical protein